MTDFEKRLREAVKQDMSVALTMLVEECGDENTYFQAKTDEGMTILIHTTDKEAGLLDLFDEAQGVLENAIEEYEKIIEEQEEQETEETDL